MIPGTRIDCVLGVVSILNFNVATEVLQGGVMTFVNQIAEIVHGVVDAYHGAVNRNSGDAFLLIWRNPNKDPFEDRFFFPEASPDNSRSRSFACDDGNLKDSRRLSEMAVVSFVKILSSVQRSPVLAQYRWHPG